MAARQSLAADLIDGAIAGAVATWAMGQVTSWLYERESRDARQREDDARGGQTAYEAAADRVAAAADTRLDDAARARWGSNIHWVLGVAAGAVYGVLRPRLASPALARSLAFGSTFWLVADEIAVPALGLTPGPTAFPWQTHARGLVGHAAFGTVADAVLGVLGSTAGTATA